MGLSESKTPFEANRRSQRAEIDKEIGISQMVDPRSPSCDFERTPVYYRNERQKAREEDIVVVDPRSPSNEITRTPISASDSHTTTDEAIENELRVQIERLKLFDSPILHQTNSSENLASDKEIIDAKKTVLKLLEEEEPLSLANLPNTPPQPRSRSTPKETASPETPISSKKETEDLIKKKKKPSNGKRHNKASRQTNSKLKKTVLKKAFMDQAARSPLAERNAEASGKDGRLNVKKSSKSTGLVKYKKYSTLDESFTGDSFPGKENEEVVW